MYREFLYLDADLIQSVIAQLKEGLLTQIVEGKEKSLEGRTRLAAGVLSHLFPIGVEGVATRTANMQSSKILHDYAYSIALEALYDNNMLVEFDDKTPASISLPDSAFVLVRGSVNIVDFDIVREFAKHEDFINSLAKNVQASQDTPKQGAESPRTTGPNRDQRRAMSHQQKPNKQQPPKSSFAPAQSALQGIRQFLDSFTGDFLIVRATLRHGVTFSGPLVRSSLREDIRHYIFKRGGAPQVGWTMLGQVSVIPDANSKLLELAGAMEELTDKSEEIRQRSNTALDILTILIEPLYRLQEAIASVSYPEIAVTPLAIYREVGAVQ